MRVWKLLKMEQTLQHHFMADSGRFQNLKFFGQKNFPPKFGFFHEILNFVQRCYRCFICCKTHLRDLKFSFSNIWWPQNKNFHPRTHPENHKNRDFCIFLMLTKSSSRMSSCKNSYLKVLPLNSSETIDVFCTIYHPFTVSRTEFTSLWKFMIFMVLDIKK